MKLFRFNSSEEVEAPRVDFDNDRLNEVVLVQQGVAKGHDIHLNAKFINDIAKQGKRAGSLRANLSHPNMCSDANGSYLGEWENYTTRKVGDKLQALADLQLNRAIADKSPRYSQSVTDYVLQMANDRPDRLMSSIVFNGTSETIKEKDNEGKVVTRDYAILVPNGFQGADLVAVGAATTGMFSEFNLAAQVSEFLSESTINHDEFLELMKLPAFTQFAETLFNNPKISSRLLNIVLNKPDVCEEFIEKYNSQKTVDFLKVAEMFDLKK